MNWFKKLQKYYNLSTKDIICIMWVFSLTGFTILFIKPFILAYFGITPSTKFTIFYLILIFPVYNALLLAYGFLFGYLSYFWNREKRMFLWLRAFFRSKK